MLWGTATFVAESWFGVGEAEPRPIDMNCFKLLSSTDAEDVLGR